MEKTHKLVILGDSAFAEIACEYFTHDSPYEVVGFSVEQAFLKRDELFGLPVVPFESIDTHFPPGEHFFFAAITYVQLNRLRTRLYNAAKNLGYRPASYVSSRAFVWRNVEMGEHCFIFEGNVVQPFVRIGENVVLWSGNHIGHHSTIGANCFIASHAVVSGFVNIGENCFVGVNTTFSNNIVVGKDCLIGAGAMVARDVPEDKVVKGEAGEPTGSARRLNRVKE
ncbi:acetyltransferase [Paraburkholderia caribensis]|uniref:acetyltransferase n=1 Tax=Paraburkholderia caribensis TaxID=75105 RepID=UPI0028622C80|nr:acetyltransferase [Paraburkholderia caribensis]MDR6383867.1 sugar O-acyltransferase (sialic acid O-acetyltransferase NeuD family) [Paraburkholderia caribensis]